VSRWKISSTETLKYAARRRTVSRLAINGFRVEDEYREVRLMN